MSLGTAAVLQFKYVRFSSFCFVFTTCCVFNQTYAVLCLCRKRVVAVLQEMLALPQTPSSLVSLLTEKLLTLIPDDQRRIQTVSYILHLNLSFLIRVSFPSHKGRRKYWCSSGINLTDQLGRNENIKAEIIYQCFQMDTIRGGVNDSADGCMN